MQFTRAYMFSIFKLIYYRVEKRMVNLISLAFKQGL